MENELQRLIAHVGTERYAAAREHTWRSAAGTGRAREPGLAPARAAGESVLSSVVSDLVDLTWDATERPEQERLALAMALYRDLPSYAVLMYGTSADREFTGETRAAFWAAYRALLADPDDRLADPIAYSLWCDYFEDPKTVHDAWQGVDPGTSPRRGLERLLDAAGPVPWALKAPLYQRLVPDPSWHRAIFGSLRSSRFDAYGQIDATQALRLLNQLRLTRETGGLAELRARLEAESRQPAARQKGRRPRRARD